MHWTIILLLAIIGLVALSILAAYIIVGFSIYIDLSEGFDDEPEESTDDN